MSGTPENVKTRRYVVEGVALPQGRPRFDNRGPFPRAIDPRRSREWKTWVRMAVLQQRLRDGENAHPPHTGPVEMFVTFILPRPESLPKRVKSHTKKPDLTNLVKGIEDALEGIVYKNDSQTCTMRLRKEYGTPFCVIVEVVTWNE